MNENVSSLALPGVYLATEMKNKKHTDKVARKTDWEIQRKK